MGLGYPTRERFCLAAFAEGLLFCAEFEYNRRRVQKIGLRLELKFYAVGRGRLVTAFAGTEKSFAIILFFVREGGH